MMNPDSKPRPLTTSAPSCRHLGEATTQFCSVCLQSPSEYPARCPQLSPSPSTSGGSPSCSPAPPAQSLRPRFQPVWSHPCRKSAHPTHLLSLGNSRAGTKGLALAIHRHQGPAKAFARLAVTGAPGSSLGRDLLLTPLQVRKVLGKFTQDRASGRPRRPFRGWSA